ncbi:GNAT family N-acetyltransferase [Polyangium sp. 15x6]|uniref:GNAT family N-acetyltransferase n=1 Tax=Polyangium sp. 15x6 TaxID=3042687 RepID=UPI00249B18F6|nr:GNAT family N-acetyltransferase [Polyangium sp. 15x6]MDI3287641.1 GNAT family N-acetyltransferase [Polyangium sp. 15x6]
MTTSPGFLIERADARHRDFVLHLLSEHLPGSDVGRRYTWLYEQNPHGRAVTAIARDERSGEPLGITSVFPRRMLIAGRVRLGSIGGDGYVRPSARRRGIATAMHRASLEMMRAEGVEVMFGPPEPHNLRALERAGARIVCHVRRFARPRLLQSILGPLGRLAARGARLVPIEGRDARVDRIFERAVDDTVVTPVRDAAHYAWRFVESPSRAQRAFVVLSRDEPLGLCVLEHAARRVALVDLVAHPDDFGHALSIIASSSGADALVTQLNERGPNAGTLGRAGFFPREGKPFQVHAREGMDPAVFDARRWYYAWGDGDLDRVL